MEPDIQLTPEEHALFTHCAQVWGNPYLGMSSMKSGELSENLKQRLTRLGAIFHLTVTFPVDDGQRYIMAVRTAPTTP